ncbi:MAG: AAA family ATPase [Lachnospiraceae bacterium]|nr:AAA family ATPase [Lachnospiraceae bacterium]
MKIKNISCSQFAGIRDRDVSFEDGINVVYGKNESGKSTLVNLLSRTLFQNAHIDKRSDKEFVNTFFPGTRRGSVTGGDFADGKVTFETEAGTYSISKEWGDERCRLSAPQGIISDPKRIDEALRNALQYGEGVYSDLLFSSQRNTDLALQTILDVKEKGGAKQEITDVVTVAFAESDGISVDAIEQAIEKKISQIKGKHWDTDREMPDRKTGGRWARDLGEILEAYYVLEDKQGVLQHISDLESKADEEAKKYNEREAALRDAEEAFAAFDKYASRLAVQSVKKKEINRLKEDIQKFKKILEKWPTDADELRKAIELNAEQESRGILDQYSEAKQLVDKLDEFENQQKGMFCPEQTEISEVENAQRRISILENKLCGMNLSAVIKMLGDHTVEVKSRRTGDTLDISGENISITEAVSITIPGVVEMQMAPADVDVIAVEKELAQKKSAVASTFAKYSVNTVGELREKAQEFDKTQREIDSVKRELKRVLGDSSYEELTELRENIQNPIREKEEINDDIRELCKNANIIRFVATKEAVIGEYEREHESIDSLRTKISEKMKTLKEAEESVEESEDIPPEYRDISDPEQYKKALKADIDTKKDPRDVALQMKQAAGTKLEAYQKGLTGDPAEDLERAERRFEETKVLLAHWLNIRDVFQQQKELLANNPMQDLADSFAHYLGVISANRVTTEFPDMDKLSMNIYSNDLQLDYGKLSEGTKETVSLAFRLAVLDHLFPEGGVIVLDDPFTDMDIDRVEQSCELLKECAKRHQVIFLTCREEYTDRLNGTLICIE